MFYYSQHIKLLLECHALVKDEKEWEALLRNIITTELELTKREIDTFNSSKNNVHQLHPVKE